MKKKTKILQRICMGLFIFYLTLHCQSNKNKSMKSTKRTATKTQEAEVQAPSEIVETVAENAAPTPEAKIETPQQEIKTSNPSKKMENTTKSAFDFLIEAQSKFVDTLADNEKKITETLHANETIEKARTFVTEFLEKQQANLESVTETIKKQTGFEKTPEVVQEVVKAQQDFGKEWFEALRATLKAKDLKELNEILIANVEKLQENVKSIAGYAVENFGKPVNFTELFTTEYAKDVTTKWLNMWKPVVK